MTELFDITLFHAAIVFAGAVIAGALNSVAGGGTFFAFPALLMTGVTPISANATASVAVWPGVIASAFGYREQLHAHKHHLPLMITVGLAGGFIGAQLLLMTSDDEFRVMIPWLLLVATILFAFGKPITKVTSKAFAIGEGITRRSLILACILLVIISIYGGFFGAGIGILMLAMLQIMGMEDIHEMNAFKTALGAGIHGSAVLAFLFSDIVAWTEAGVMVVGASIGGYYGARFALKIDPKYIRYFVIAVGVATTTYFFIKG